MKKTDNYSAIVTIENIVGDPSKVDENSLFTLLTRLAIGEGRIFDMGIILASRDDKYSGHVELAEKRLPSQSTSIQSPYQFPYDRAAVAVGICLETPLQELGSVKEFSAEELAEAWPRLRYGIYI